MIENAYHGSVGGMATNTYGRVDQLEDRYLGMVEAPSSNLGTSTPLSLIDIECGPCCKNRASANGLGLWLGKSTTQCIV